MTFLLPSSEACKQSANHPINTAKGRLHGRELERKQHLKMPALRRMQDPFVCGFSLNLHDNLAQKLLLFSFLLEKN